MINQVYMNEVLRSVVLSFLVKASDSTRPRMTLPERTSLEPAKTMLCALTGQYPIRHVYNFNMSMTFWKEGLTHNNGTKKPPVARGSVAGDDSTKSPVFRVCETGASPNLPLTGDTLATDEGILIFEM